METKQYTTVDKSKWQHRGPWDREPDKMQWQDEETKLPCLIVRNMGGALCGYVGVAEGHPFFGKKYDEVAINCHGGPTFSDFCSPGDDESHSICHVPAPGEPDRVWWFGFDCSHCYDFSPGYGISYPGEPRRAYRNIRYVQRECAELAKQLVEAAQQ